MQATRTKTPDASSGPAAPFDRWVAMIRGPMADPVLPHRAGPAMRLGMLVSAALVVVGSLGAWVESSVANVYGTQGLGWFGAAAGVLAAGLLSAGLRSQRVRWPLRISVVIGGAGLVVACFLATTLQVFGAGSWLWRTILTRWGPTAQIGDFHASTGWGVYMLALGSLGLMALPLFTLARSLYVPRFAPFRRFFGASMRGNDAGRESFVQPPPSSPPEDPLL
jgi:hypothetical protein